MAASRAAYPPSHIPSAPTPIPPSAAESLLSAYLKQTPHKAHLHPDSLLSSTGIQFSANSGPKGGLALHHLTRIAAGLRGENLVQETQEELEAQFAAELGAPSGDDERLDDAIGRAEGKGKRSRSMERVREWDDRSAAATQAAGAEVDAKFAAEGEEQGAYELKQEVWEGDVGDRDGAPVVERNASVPEIRTHDTIGGEKPAKKKVKTESGVAAAGGGGGKVDKEARKAAKKARRDAEKREKEVERKRGVKKEED